MRLAAKARAEGSKNPLFTRKSPEGQENKEPTPIHNKRNHATAFETATKSSTSRLNTEASKSFYIRHHDIVIYYGDFVYI